MARYKPAKQSSFDRMYKKLTPQDQQLADDAIRRLFELVNLEDLQSDHAEKLAQDSRTKKITKFKKESPPRMEATFAPDGRIVWRLDQKRQELVLVYIGKHAVLNKE